MFKGNLFQVLIFLMLSIFGINTKASTLVGNGTDFLSEYLDTARKNLEKTLGKIIVSKNQKNLCQSQIHLTQEKLNFCDVFLKNHIQELVELVHDRKMIQFVIIDDSLIEESTGRPIQAGTNCGKIGPIYFDFFSVRELPPKTVIAKMTHEFLHKIPLIDGKCLTDYQSIGPFDGQEGGRNLLDAVGNSIAQLALDYGEIKETFKIIDYYTCEWKNSDANFGSSNLIRSNRTFFHTSHRALRVAPFLGEYYDPLPHSLWMSGIGLGASFEECSLVDYKTKQRISIGLRVFGTGECTKGGIFQVQVHSSPVNSILETEEPTNRRHILSSEIQNGLPFFCSESRKQVQVPITLGNGTRIKFTIRLERSRINFY